MLPKDFVAVIDKIYNKHCVLFTFMVKLIGLQGSSTDPLNFSHGFGATLF